MRLPLIYCSLTVACTGKRDAARSLKKGTGRRGDVDLIQVPSRARGPFISAVKMKLL